MASLDDLDDLGEREYVSIEEWFVTFTDEERDKIVNAIRVHPPGKVWDIVSKLDDNPFPFMRPAFNQWARALRTGSR